MRSSSIVTRAPSSRSAPASRAVPGGLVHVFLLEHGVLADDALGVVAVAEELEHEIDGDAKATDRGLSFARA